MSGNVKVRGGAAEGVQVGSRGVETEGGGVPSGTDGTDGSKMARAGSATRRKFGENGNQREVSTE
jgi:hypothetical protein